MKTNEDSSQTSRLLDAAAQGDRRAVEQLIEVHRNYLRKIIDLRMDDALRVRVDPSDVVQETQLVACQRINDFLKRRPTSFRIWLRRKALEQLVDLRRRHILAEKRSVRREYTLSNRSSMAIARSLMYRPPSEQTHRQEAGRQVREAIASMSVIDREVLLLRHVEELSNAESAEVMKVDPATASQRYGRALRRLRDALHQQGFYDEQ
jgi:RNA polymerase sigma-70 factor, ECF subfamily